MLNHNLNGCSTLVSFDSEVRILARPLITNFGIENH
jgi:hypothetical protein